MCFLEVSWFSTSLVIPPSGTGCFPSGVWLVTVPPEPVGMLVTVNAVLLLGGGRAGVGALSGAGGPVTLVVAAAVVVSGGMVLWNRYGGTLFGEVSMFR